MDPINQIMLFIWIGFAVVFFIAEMLTATFGLLWFAVGAAVAAVLAAFNLPFWLQIAVALVISTVLFALSRKFFKRITRNAAQTGVGADRSQGKEGIVIERIDPLTNQGKVRVEHEEWIAENVEGKPIEPGKKVEVVRVEGVRLFVKLKEE